MLKISLLLLVVLTNAPRAWTQSVALAPGRSPNNIYSPGQFASGSSTAGIQEAINHAGNGGVVVIPAGNYSVRAQVQMLFQRQTVYAHGAIVTCTVPPSTECWMIGTSQGLPGSAVVGNTIYGLHLSPGPNTVKSSALRDNGQSTHLYDLGFIPNGRYTFYHGIENDNDQSQVIEHLYDVAGVITCNSTECGSALWAPGPFSTYAAITWIVDSDLSMGCQGNSIDWQSGNHLTVSRSIIQAFSQWGVRVVNSLAAFDGLDHWERGNCVNPLNDGKGHALGAAGLMMENASVTAEGSAPGGAGTTKFITNAPGAAIYQYYVVANKSGSHSSPLVAGTIPNGPATIDSSHWVVVVWPQLLTATSYDVLRVSYPGDAPYGTGNYAVAVGLRPADVCEPNGVCSFQDAATVPASYTVRAANGSYPPSATFWPGDIVLMSGPAEASFYNVGSYQGPGAGGGVVVNAAAYDTSHPHLAYFPGSQLNWQNNKSPISPGNVLAIANNDSSNQLLPGILLPKYVPDGSALNRKGLINLGAFQDDRSGPTDLITFYDSNYQKTLSAESLRPSWDAGDSALCEDNSSGTDLCLRAGSAWSAYIGTAPDGTSWLQRLTASREVLRVPLETGQASNTDNAGQIRLDANGTGSYTFTASHANAPICILQDFTNLAHVFTVSVSASSLAISRGTSRDVVNYICWGRN